jgi:integrase
VDGYQRNVASVKRKDISEAVEEFIAIRKPLTEAKAGKRAQLSKNYAYMVSLWLRDFAKTFPASAVCDLGKEHLNLFMRKSGSHSPKSRNHYRGAVKMFLTWCVKRDYLSPAHRLFEADSMATEAADTPELEYYRPEELKAMLDRAGENPDFKELLPVIALGGLAGLRLEEILRLEWADIWRVPGHVEIKAQKAKTRSRRLVEVCPALAAWLEPYREFSGAIFARSKDMFHETFGRLRDSLKIQARRNGLRHAFCTYHFAAHANENLTAAQAGNSPAMIHAHYKGLATKAEAEKWFNVIPPGAAKNVIPLRIRKP